MIKTSLIDEWIAEDVPYFDLTTHLLGIGDEQGSIGFFSRDPITLACTYEAEQILRRFDLDIVQSTKDGTKPTVGDVFLKATGRTDNIHKAWKATLNLFEYACGISTRTAKLVAAARAVNPEIAVLTTRKVFPGTKAVSITAAIAGGALPHRLGLGETILLFDHHIRKAGGWDAVAKLLPKMKQRVCDKEICVEVETEEDALAMIRAGADALQFDKVAPDVLSGIVAKIRDTGSTAKLIAAGGVNGENAGAYAATGIDAISTTWIYFGRPADMSVVIE
ncbi:MAG: ModD protein [Clostridiales Family XIII bacterium]|jgi:molybdenum transport protein|nr:ModD protein [Clostridiales Family XIII bacterium]